jgi:hypothetical protein
MDQSYHTDRSINHRTIFQYDRYMGAGVLAMFVSSATNLAFPTLVGKVLDRTAGQKQVRIKACVIGQTLGLDFLIHGEAGNCV